MDVGDLNKSGAFSRSHRPCVMSGEEDKACMGRQKFMVDIHRCHLACFKIKTRELSCAKLGE